MSVAPALRPDVQIAEIVFAKIRTHALGVFAELGIADHLAAGPRSAAELAAATGANATALFRLLRLLAAYDVVALTDDGTFRLTEAGQLLRSDVPRSLRGIAAMFGGELHSRAWARLNHSVMTGEPAFDHVFGMPLFDYLSQHPESAAMFDNAMTSSSSTSSAAVVGAYDFSGIGTLVDVGGGHGTLLATVLKHNPALRGVLLDLPHVIDGAGPLFEDAGVRDRVEFVGLDFLERVAPGADAYIMKRILHDWDDARAVRILSNCRRALAPGGRILVVDPLIDESPTGLPAKQLDIEMLVLTAHGLERTEDQFRALFAEAGLKLDRIISTASHLKIIEGRPV